MIYLIFASIYITVISIQMELRQNAFSVGALFHNKAFATIIVSLMSTYVVWFLASFLFLDPWHMFTSVSLSTFINFVLESASANLVGKSLFNISL